MNSDTLTTAIGVGEAVIASAVTFYTTSNADGSLDLHNPIFWLGMAISTLAGVRGYWTNKHLTQAVQNPTAAVAK